MPRTQDRIRDHAQKHRGRAAQRELVAGAEIRGWRRVRVNQLVLVVTEVAISQGLRLTFRFLGTFFAFAATLGGFAVIVPIFIAAGIGWIVVWVLA